MKKMISKNLIHIVFLVLTFTLILNLFIQIINAQGQMNEDSEVLFQQVDSILMNNTAELEEVTSDYRNGCLTAADAAAYIFNQDPSIMNDLDEMKKVASLIQVDEIHIFDANGTITTGTNPEYYNLSMNSGEQISFFLPLLQDKSLRLCQDVTPNTAENKPMQYAAVWAPSEEYIVQIGMTPTRVIDATKKNELSYIFSLLTTNTGYNLYAIDMESGKILGSTDTDIVGKNVTELGLSTKECRNKAQGFHTRLNGESIFCTTHVHNSILVVRFCTSKTLYNHIGLSTTLVFVYLLIIAHIMVLASINYINKNVITSINSINKELTDITAGDLDTTIDTQTTPEFTELGSHINTMIQSLLDYTDKMSYVLTQAELPIAVYEYSNKYSKVRATDEIGNILCLDEDECKEILNDCVLFEQQIQLLRENPYTDFPNTYMLQRNNTRYIKLESFSKDGNMLGILIDITNNINKHIRTATERDIDSLTGLYNRRALESKLDSLFKDYDKLGHSALIMLDADGLKSINDTYGHELGDKYLIAISDLLKSISPPESIIARQGGDEFVLFYYGFDSQDKLENAIEVLRNNQDDQTVSIHQKATVTIRFSMGYSLCYGKGDDYSTLIREADIKMYEEKKSRKSNR